MRRAFMTTNRDDSDMPSAATQGGISRALFQFAAAVMGRFRGGLAMAAVLACAAFGAICGSSVATAATITGVALPEMKRHGYSGRLSTGTLAAGGTLGILIPPSVPLVIYAILTEQNIAKLFVAAFLPGILATLGYMLAIAVYVRRHPAAGPAGPHHTAAELSLVKPGFYEKHGIKLFLNEAVKRIDRTQKVIETNQGQTLPYDTLVLATGSSPFVPPVRGNDRERALDAAAGMTMPQPCLCRLASL